MRSVVLAVSLAITSAEAQWQPQGVRVCTADSYQTNAVAVPDGGGGAILAWLDGRGPVPNVYVQRLDGAGVRKWSSNGILVTSIFNTQNGAVAVGDGAGGAIVAWLEDRSGERNVYAQRFNSDGVRLWGSGGAPVCEATGEQFELAIISDGRNSPVQTPGAIIAWKDDRAGVSNSDIYAQALDANGIPRWTANGVQVCTDTGIQRNPVMVTDGTGTTQVAPRGAIIAWQDARGAGDIYAQRLNAAGVPQWGTDGIVVCVDPSSQGAPAAAFIGSGSAIIAWADARNGPHDIYAQRVGGGVVGWPAGGLPVCQASSTQYEVEVISDGKGGAILAWSDRRKSPDAPAGLSTRAPNAPPADSTDIYAQRVDGTGSPLWTVGGVELCTATGEQSSPVLVRDATGGAIVAWVDKRGVSPGGGFDPQEQAIHVQRVDKAGVVSWTPNGLRVGLVGEKSEVTAIPDNAGSAIVAWTDRNPSTQSIYANRLSGGVVGVEPSRVERFRLRAPFPNPTPGPMSVSFELPAPRKVIAQVFGVDGRLVRVLAEGEEFAAGLRTLHWDGRAVSRVRARNGVYFVRVRAGADSEVRKILIMQ